MTLSLFFFFSGSIPPVEVAEASTIGPAMRGSGVILGMLLLIWLVQRSRITGTIAAFTRLTPLAPLLAFCFLSVVWSDVPGATIVRSLETSLIVAYTTLWAYLAARLIGDQRKVFNAIAGAMVMIAIQGLLMNVLIAGTPFRIVLLSDETDRWRLVFGYLHPLVVGDMLAVGIIALCGSAFRVLSKAVLGLSLLYLLVLTDSTAALLLTLTIGFALLVMNARESRVLIARALVAMLVLLVAVTAMVATGWEPWQPLLADQRLWTMTGRLNLWHAISSAGLTDTWFGTGFDASRPAIYRVFGSALSPHNAYLGVLVELGYIGLGLSLVFVASLLWRLARRPSALAWAFALFCFGVGITNPLLLKANTLFPLILAFAWPAFAASARGVGAKSAAAPVPGTQGFSQNKAEYLGPLDR